MLLYLHPHSQKLHWSLEHVSSKHKLILLPGFVHSCGADWTQAPTYTDTGTHSQIHSFQANDVRGIDGNVVCGPYVPHGGPKKIAKEAEEEEGRRGWIQTLTWVWYVVPVRSVKLIVGFQDLLKQLGVVFVVEWRVSTQPADRGLLSQIFLLWFNV